jgi:hypothetical protein
MTAQPTARRFACPAFTLALGALVWTAMSPRVPLPPSCRATCCSAQIKGHVLVQTVVVPPKGWVEDEARTQRYKALVLFQNGDKSSPSR